MTKIVEFENVYIELPETYVKEDETKEAETVIDVETPSVEMIEETVEETVETVEETEEAIEIETTETPAEEPSAEEVVEEKIEEKPQIRIELPVHDKIVENALRDIEEAEKKEEKVEDPAVTKQATTKLSFEELQKRLEETQALHL